MPVGVSWLNSLVHNGSQLPVAGLLCSIEFQYCGPIACDLLYIGMVSMPWALTRNLLSCASCSTFNMKIMSYSCAIRPPLSREYLSSHGTNGEHCNSGQFFVGSSVAYPDSSPCFAIPGKFACRVL